jgi:hypothetical protein
VSQGRAVQHAARRQQRQARAQAPGRYYASLGHAVEHAARQQRQKPPEHHSLAERILGALSPHKVYGGGPQVARPAARGAGALATAPGGRGGITSASVRGVSGSIPGLAVREMGFAIAQKPKLAVELPGQLAKMVAGAPAGLVEAAANPRTAVKSTLGDYKRRYGALARGDTEAFRKRILKEGIAPEVVDLASSTVGVGAAGGRALQGAARAGKLGSRLERAATVRPALRVSGNITHEQALSKNLIRNAAAAVTDTARARVQARRAAQPDAPVEVRQAERAGEVTFVSRRRQAREQRKLVSREKGATLARMKATQQRETGAARRNLSSLTDEERRGFKVAMQLGVTTPDAARSVIARRVRDITAHREGGPRISARRDEIPALHWLNENAERVFTPNLRRVVKEEQARERRVAAADPGLDPQQAQIRRYQPVAEALGVHRAEGESVASWLRRVKQTAADVGVERPGYLRSEERPQGVFGAFALGGARAAEIPKRYKGSLFRQGVESHDPEVHVRGVARGIKRREQWNLVARNLERHALKEIPDQVRAAGETRAQALRDHQALLEKEKRGRDAATETDPKVLQEQLGELDQRHADMTERMATARAAMERARTPEARAHFEQDVRGLADELQRTETVAARLKAELDGGPQRALQRQVAESEQRIAESQRKLKEADTAVVDAARGPSARNRSILQLTRDLENAGVDPSTVGFWNPRRFYELSRQMNRDTEGAAGRTDALELGDQAVARGEQTDLQRALAESVVPGAAVMRGDPEAFAAHTGYSVVPAEVLHEIEAQVKPSGAAGRSVDIFRGKASRVLLANPGWLSFQVASNAFLAGIGGAGPTTWLKAHRWWKSLPDDLKESVAPELGIHGWYDEQTHLGATASNLPAPARQLANAWQALKGTGPWQLAHKANPFDAIFRADNAQNNFFRKAVLYKEVNREAYRRMGDNANRVMRGEQRIQRVLRSAPEDQLRAALEDPKLFEHHARAVNDLLGDYTSYTAKERRTMGRYALFYGFLRHSLRLTFYTLPVKHPLITAIGFQLGKMHEDELRKIFGVDVPVWEQANAFVKVGGKERKFDVSRLNPFFNALQFQGPQSLLSLASPMASMTVDQLAKKNTVFDSPWRLDKSTAFAEKGVPVGLSNRAQVVLEQLARLSPYYRLAEQTGIPGVAKPMRGRQGADSSLFFPQPTQYKGEAALASNERLKAEQGGTSAKDFAQRSLLPFLGEPAAPTIRSARDFALRSGKSGPAPVAPTAPAAGSPLSDPDVRRAVDAARGAQSSARGVLDDPEIRRAIDAVRAGG